MLILQEIRKPPIYFYINKRGLTKERRRNFLTINYSFLQFFTTTWEASNKTVFVSTLTKRNHCYYRQQQKNLENLSTETRSPAPFRICVAKRKLKPQSVLIQVLNHHGNQKIITTKSRVTPTTLICQFRHPISRRSYLVRGGHWGVPNTAIP